MLKPKWNQPKKMQNNLKKHKKIKMLKMNCKQDYSTTQNQKYKKREKNQKTPKQNMMQKLWKKIRMSQLKSFKKE